MICLSLTAGERPHTIRTTSRLTRDDWEHSARMIPRRLLTTLVFALPVLVVGIAVVLVAAALAEKLGDAAGALGLFWTAMAALIALVIDALLLLGILGLRALEESRDENRGA